MVIKISIIGTHQTGSTRIFNLIRLLYENLNDSEEVYSCWDYKHDKDNDYEVIISKIHECDIEYLNDFDFLILPIRNILDAALSANIRFPHISLKDSCRDNINIYNKFKDISDFIFIYEKYSLEYIKSLCKKLKINPSDEDIKKIMEELDIMHNRKDIVKKDNQNNKEFRKTLFSQDHNTSGGRIDKYKTDIDPIRLADLLSIKSIRNFLINLGYLDNYL